MFTGNKNSQFYTFIFVRLDTNTHCKICKHNMPMLAPSLSQNTRGHNLKYQILHHHGIRNRFLTSRCIKTWNNLNTSTVNATNINSFKQNLSKDLSMPNQYIYSQCCTSEFHTARRDRRKNPQNRDLKLAQARDDLN